jgi:hypothetical protein
MSDERSAPFTVFVKSEHSLRQNPPMPLLQRHLFNATRLICEILKDHVGKCFPNAVGGVHALVKLSQVIGHHMIREIAAPHTPLNHGEKILCNPLPPPPFR